MSSDTVTTRAVVVLGAVLREAGRFIIATYQTYRWHAACQARRAHFERYEGLLGPWRHARDTADGVEPPSVPSRPPLADMARAYTVLVVLVMWAAFQLRGVW